MKLLLINFALTYIVGVFIFAAHLWTMHQKSTREYSIQLRKLSASEQIKRIGLAFLFVSLYWPVFVFRGLIKGLLGIKP